MGSLSDRLAAVGGGAAPTQPTTPPPGAPAPQPQPSTPGQIAEVTTADKCVVGNLYMVIVEGGGVMKCEGNLPTGVFLTGPSGTPKMIPLATPVRDVTNDATARENFKLPPLTTAAPKPRKLDGMPIFNEHGQQVSGAPIPGAPQAPDPITGLPFVAPGTSVTPPDMPAHAPAQTVAAAPTTHAAGAPTPNTSPATGAGATPDATPSEKPRKTRGKGKGKGENVIDLDDSLILLVNSSSTEATDLGGYVLDLAQKVAAKHSIADVRLASGDHVLAFGRWKAHVAGAALAEVPRGLCSIRSGELADPIIEALAGVASIVVR